MAKKKLTLGQEQQARAGGESIETAVQTALSHVADEESIITFLPKNAEVYDLVPGFDASSLSLPEMVNGRQIVLAYEWNFLELQSEADLASDILASIRENLKSGKLSSDVAGYI